MLFAFPIFIIIYVPIRIIESLWKKLKKKHNIPEHKPLTNSQWIVAISAIAIMVTTKMVFGFPLWFIFAGAFILGIVMALASKD